MYLLDTHVFIWFSTKDLNNIPNQVQIILENNENVFLSVASIWEISIKSNLNKLELNFDLNEIENILFENRIKILPITLNHIKEIHQLEYIHKDPFDRILIAQTKYEKFNLITADENIGKYDVSILWN